MTTTTKQQLRFLSRADWRPMWMSPIVVALACGWLLSFLLFGAASVVMHNNILAAALLLVMASCLGYYMAGTTKERVTDSCSIYELLIDDSVVTLTAENRLTGVATIKQLALCDVTLGEFFSMSDASTLTLYGALTQIEIPLWLFGNQSKREIVNYFRSRNIPFMNMPRELEKEEEYGV